MKILRRFQLALTPVLIVSILSTPGFSGFNSDARGTSAGIFLEMGSGARNAAMGEASTSSQDPSVLFTNPGALTQLRAPSFVLGHAAGFEESFYDVGSFVSPIGRRSAWGAGILYSGAGSVLETDDTAVQHGSFSPNDQAGIVGFARDWGPFSSGISAKYIRSTVLKTAQTAAIDVGLASQGFLKDRLRLEAAAQNIGGKLKYETESEDLPMSIRLGAALRITRKLLLANEVVFPKTNSPYGAAGVEWMMAESQSTGVLLRGGFNGRRNKDLDGAGFMGGMGIRLKNWRLDYAFVPYGELGETHQISITFTKRSAPPILPIIIEPARPKAAPLPPETSTVKPKAKPVLKRYRL